MSVVADDTPIRLHLGCGSNYLDGYVNVDFPAEHTVQERTRQPDIECDFRTLDYEPGTVTEVRNHHVLEHFDKIEALRLLIEWTLWLSPSGSFVIETPDFESASRRFLGTDSETDRLKFARHLYGSNEADWARHLDGWWEGKFRLVFDRLGFEVIRISRPDYNHWNNILVVAEKRRELSREELLQAAEDILSMSVVLPDEQALLDNWRAQLRASTTSEGA
ncbi:MAG: hypothetical protein HGB10_05670 [Coriobacteriia bacterium]|nr:hypothetical protein [Coriobacteriia bacterium]